MLALEITLLLGRYAATDFRDRDRAEWPPHPDRLFSALVAAACESGLGESARAALLWLESQPPPAICADDRPAVQTPATVYVPVNDPTADLLPHRAERQPRAFPSVAPQVEEVGQCPSVWFIWPEARPDALLTQLLGSVAENVTYLGSSRSPVRVRLRDHFPAPNWVPDDSGNDLLRVPHKGRLESLDWHFENGLRPPVGAFQRYRCGGDKAKGALPESVFGDMVVYRLRGPMAMELQTTLKLTDVLRAAALRRAQEVGGSVPELLTGHDESGRPSARTHAAYIALPFVSDTEPHADGRVLGVAVVLPRQLDREERRLISRALAKVDHLMVPGVGRLDLERLTAEMVPPYNLRQGTWGGPARRWASVTPVLLDRFPKRGGLGLGTILKRSCEHVGLPVPDEVLPDRYSPLHGVEPSFRFVTRRSSQEKARLYTHVTLTFGERVCGPILLGAGRYFGLGLLRPLQEDVP
jgi:CRISPR-associated protein Csb2